MSLKVKNICRTNDMIPDLDSKNIKTICVYCWGLLGDVFVRVPVIEALKQKFPDSRITVVVDSYSRKVIDNHPDIDSILIYDRKKKPRFKYLINSIKGILYLRRKKFDLSINLYSGGTSALITRLTNARIRIGFNHTKKLRKANNVLVEHPSICQNATKVLAELLIPLEINKEQVRSGSSYYCLPKYQKKAKILLNDKNVKYIGLNLGASTPDKIWSVQNIVTLLTEIAKDYNIVPVVFENPGQEYLAHEFNSLYKVYGKSIMLTGFKFPEEAAVLEKCDILITGDTGLMHLGSGVKTPLFAFFLVTRPEPVMPEDCPFHACMIESKDGIDNIGWAECGWTMLENNISVEFALNNFRNFVINELGWSEVTDTV